MDLEHLPESVFKFISAISKPNLNSNANSNPNPKAMFTDLRNLMRNFSTFLLACLYILLAVRKVSYIDER